MKTIEEKAVELEQQYHDALAKLDAAKVKADELAKIDAAIEEQRKIRDGAHAVMRELRAEREKIAPKRTNSTNSKPAVEQKDPRITTPKKRRGEDAGK